MNKKALLVIENSPIPQDVRVWQEATTLRDAGWTVTVICPKGDENYPNEERAEKIVTSKNLEGITILSFPLAFSEKGITGYLVEYLSAFLAIARLSWREWRRGHFHIIHFGNPPDIFFPIGIFYRLLGVRVIFDHHDLFPEFVLSRFHGVARRLLYGMARGFEFLTFRSANIVISTNQSYRRIAIERGGLPADRVIVVRNGPVIDQFTPVEPVPSLKSGFPYLACFAGVMGSSDGVLELISSIHYIVNVLDRHDILFVLLGNGGVFSQAMKQVLAWGLQDIIFMPGMVRDRLLLRQYLCTADVLLSPEPLTPLNQFSTFVKIGEYMAMEKPIIAFNLAETRYTAQDAAMYVEPGNIEAFGQAIVALLNDLKLCNRMGKIGRQRVVDVLSWEHQQEKLLQAYAQALR